MWSKIADKILNNKILIIILISLITIYMGYKSKDVKLDYHYTSLLPKYDTAYIDLMEFKSKFGEDGNMLIIGLTDKNFFQKDKFNDWIKIQDSIGEVESVLKTFSITDVLDIKKNVKDKKFDYKKIFPKHVNSQEELDSLKTVLNSYPFYNKLAYFKEKNMYMLGITMDADVLNSKRREKIVENIEKIANNWGQKYNVKVRYSGLPYYRTKKSLMVQHELYMFIFLAMLVTAIIMFLFFRSFKIVMFSMLIVGIGAIWAFGTMGILGYSITVLTGILPTLLIVIGIPNSVFLLNKFHHEFRNHGDRYKALHTVISKVGNATFLTNLTTASGFATFVITGNNLLIEFGIVASLNIMAVFLLSITLVPIIFSLLNPPEEKHIRHLDFKLVNKVVNFFLYIVQNRRKYVYILVLTMLIAAIYGVSKVHALGFIVDDIPKDNSMYVDLMYFEKNAGGVMPIELMVSKRKKTDSINFHTLAKVNQLQEELKGYKSLSRSISVTDAIKFANQVYYRGKEKFYKFPNLDEANRLEAYMKNQGNGKEKNIAGKFIDSTYNTVRISIRAKDIGTVEMDKLKKNIEKEMKTIFPQDIYKTSVTGSSVVFTRGTAYLVDNLFSSLALAIVLISLFMAIMFSSAKMIVISLIPNILPLIFTAAIMGYFSVPIKPSTVLVFSIAFGISVDNAIHFLTKYRIELKDNNGEIKKSVINALAETGVSIVYTATILFFGFGIFTFSDFGGTVAMGTLVAITLLFAMLSNLLLLPSILLSLEKRTSEKQKNK